jgi:nitrate reductase delta subunit
MDMHDLLATLLTYPRDDYLQVLAQCRAACPAEASRHLAAFAERIGGLFAAELEESYTRTFDLNPQCALEVGWHLFGDTYDRGEFLVLMRQQLRRHGLEESAELPDHLTHVLPLLSRMAPDEAAALASRYVLPALEKMLAGLGGRGNPFEALLRAARCLVARAAAPCHPDEVGHA